MYLGCPGRRTRKYDSLKSNLGLGLLVSFIERKIVPTPVYLPSASFNDFKKSAILLFLDGTGGTSPSSEKSS